MCWTMWTDSRSSDAVPIGGRSAATPTATPAAISASRPVGTGRPSRASVRARSATNATRR